MFVLYEEVYVCGDNLRVYELIEIKGVQVLYCRIKIHQERDV
jgi:hypothetical protein